MLKILYICTCLREGTIFEGTIIGIGCAWGQFVQIVPSGGDNNTLCPRGARFGDFGKTNPTNKGLEADIKNDTT